MHCDCGPSATADFQTFAAPNPAVATAFHILISSGVAKNSVAL